MQIHSVGIDLGKTTFHLVALGTAGKLLVKKKFTQRQLLAYTANMQISVIGLEACSGAHFLGRALRKQGHDVRLIAAQFVKPFVKSNKNDFVYLFVDMQKRTLTYAGAGHPPCSSGVDQPRKFVMFWKMACFWGNSLLQRILPWNCSSTPVIEFCSTPTEFRKRRTRQKSSLARTASGSFWRRNKAPLRISLPVSCSKRCPASRPEGQPKTWMTILRWWPST
jgi:hypothetical protein